MSESAPIGTGRDADVYALGPDRVLRRYRRGGDVEYEAGVMRHLAAHGYPVPAVYRAEGADLEMERLDGPTMLAALMDGGVGVGDAGRTLADLHHRLHAVPAPSGEQASLLHMDLHPDNVMLTDRGPVVIDWRDAREGRAELDVATTCVVFGSVAVSDSGPMAEMAGLAMEFVVAFLPLVAGQVLAGLDEAVAIRSHNPNLDERERRDVVAAAMLIREIAERS